MKVALIYPSFGEKLRAPQLEPLTMAALAGLTPADIEVSFWDDRVEDIPYDEPVDLAAISVQTFTAKRAYEIAREYHKRHVPVVMGGFHVSFVPEEALDYADAVVVGEAEEQWPKVLMDMRNGQLQKVYRTLHQPTLQGLKYRRDIFIGKRYLPINLIEFGRGCPSTCNFCAVSAFFHHQRQCRPISDVIEEIRSLPRKTFMFVDDNLVGDQDKAMELFNALIPLKKHWMAQTGIEITGNDELLNLAKKSGCYGLMIGFESLKDQNLRQMGKTAEYNRVNFEQAIQKIHGYGIKICASFLFGYDHDTKDDFSATLAFAMKKKFLLGLFNHLTPFPGTAYYRLLQTQKRLTFEKWWLAPGYRWGDVVYQPKNCTAQELSEGCRWSRRMFYGVVNIFRRMFLMANARPLWSSVIINFLIRKDVFEKQGFLLGRNVPLENDL